MNVKWNLVDLSSFLECNLWWFFSMRLHFHIFLVCCSQNDYQWLGKRWRKWDLRDPIKPSTNLECKITVNDESHWSRFQFKRISTFRLALVPSIAQLSSVEIETMGVNMEPATSGNSVFNPLSTATVEGINQVEKEEAVGDPIENLLPALLQIFLTVRLFLPFSLLSSNRRSVSYWAK